MNRILQWTLLGVSLLFGAGAAAQEEDKRSIELSLELTSELQATHRGDCNYVNLLRLGAALPIGRRLTLEASSISTCMTAAESIGGDLQIFSNIDAGNLPFALSVCGISWQVNDRHTLFGGIRNMNEDYFTSPVTALFTNSSCGIYPTIGANFPIANYPWASVGVHYRYSDAGDDEGLAVQASLYNGWGYSRFTGRENVFRFCPQSDGIFGLVQAEYHSGGSGYYLGTAVRHGPELGVGVAPWFYTEQHIAERLSLIAGYSHAFGTSVLCRDFAGVGVRLCLPKAELGLFTDYARFVWLDEFATEVTCKLPLTRHISLQPSVHLISSDGFLCAGSLRFGVPL